ncbi:MAG: hypothetical protein HY403_01800 [Elusimicrobia bacterium]|nr:hypothetical protein [Elusimicrobiota bacterium]
MDEQFQRYVRRWLERSIENGAREFIRMGGDPIELSRAFAPVLRELAEFYARIVESWEAAGGDPEVAGMLSGSTPMTPEQVARWLAGESAEEIIRRPSQPGA